MSDLGPTTQMTNTIFRESLLDHKNSLLAFLSWRGYCLVLFFSRESVFTPFADRMISEPPINSRKNIIHGEVVVQVNL